jgi:hypothetical protein
MTKPDSALVCFFGTLCATMVALFAIKYDHPYFGMTWGLLLAAGAGWLSHGVYRQLYWKELFLFGEDWNEYRASWREKIIRGVCGTLAVVAAIASVFWAIGPNTYVIVRVFGESNLQYFGWQTVMAMVLTVASAALAGYIVFHVFGTTFKRMVSAVIPAATVLLTLCLSMSVTSLEKITLVALMAGFLAATLCVLQRSFFKGARHASC